MNIEFKITREGQDKLDRWRLQEDNSSNGRYKIQVTEIEFNEYSGVVTYYFTPLIHVKDEVELAAKRDCDNCHGQGYIRYWYYQDESRTAPCPKCFPDNQKAQAALRQWLDFVK